jgi:hypothetical protein
MWILCLLLEIVTGPVGAENWVNLCDLHILVDETAEPVSAEYADGRPGTWRGVARGRC